MGTVFERFNDRARRVLVLAQEEARLLEHNHIGTEHILLGVIRQPDGVSARALAFSAITLQAVRDKIKERVGPAASGTTGSPPFTASAKKVLEGSLREALQLGHKYIGPEHLFLSLLREDESMATQVLVSLGVDSTRMRQSVIQLLSGFTAETSVIGTAVVGERVGGIVDTPSCRGCGKPLPENLSYRTLTAEPAGDATDPEQHPQPVVVVFCRNCGRTIGVLPG